jgi:predicted metal-dependent enzyme (double-stranded beta helix superfamily)
LLVAIDPSSHLAAVLGEVDTLDWETPPVAHRAVSSIFAAVDIEDLLTELRAGFTEIVDPRGSVEKTTHYKWLLGKGDPAERFEAWLHEYKPKTHRREGHASVPHNHRFWLTSLILKGGFTDTRFERSTDAGDDGISVLQTRAMRPGDTMVIAPEEIHSLSELRDGTFSLIVQSQKVRSYSEVFEDGAVRRYYDLDAKLLDTQALL